MALYVINGILKNNTKRWKKYRVLNDEADAVFEVKKDSNDKLYIEEINKPEKNSVLVDEATGIRYFLAVKDSDPEDTVYDAILYLDSNDCVDMCEVIHENNLLIKELQSSIAEIGIDIDNISGDEETENGWKLI